MLLKDDLLRSSNALSSSAGGSGLSTTKPDEEYVPYLLINMATPEIVAVSGSSMLNNKSLYCVTSAQKLGKDDNKLHENPLPGGVTVLPSHRISANILRSNMKSTHAKVTDVTVIQKTAVSVSQATNKTTQTRVYAGQSPSGFTNSKMNSPANQIAKPRTWHRINNTSVSLVPAEKSIPDPVPMPPKKVATVQSSSYVRSGNTLVRKPAAVTAIANDSPALGTSDYWLNPSGIDETEKNAGSASFYTGVLTPNERPKTPPLLHSTKLSDCKPTKAGVLSSSPLECPPLKDSKTTLNPVKCTEQFLAQFFPTSNSEWHNIKVEGNLGKKMRYVKRKSNQLVAAPYFGDHVQDVGKAQDGYYKRRKNQLIRTSAGSQVMQRADFRDDPVYSEMQRTSEVNLSSSFIKQQSSKGPITAESWNGKAKMYKHARFCSVWTLNNQPSINHGVSLQRQNVWPHLIPWKRAKDWRSLLHMSSSIPNNSSSSLISRKLLLSRKRDTIYTRSPHGFSLHMSKLGGASMKWSKSIEKNSKRANEDATVAVEKEKREKNSTTRSIVRSKSRNNIFRKFIHSIELHPDEEPSTSLQSQKQGKGSYVPKRVLIGHDEYVRIGNGNQLVRDPMKRTRIFTNEKVRWSLHTARLRLARKRKYCQFFTRFGNCDKDGNKCPYIHDPSKTAVCTIFLNNSCSDTNCQLTHKVIPERMQDCAYFLQGICSNEHCPFRHVNVNTNASPCEDFLRGYCADGNECQKKHTYICSNFEATGICPQGSTCKLHHPKNQSRGVKRKQQSGEQQQQKKKNARGRYFGSKRPTEVVVNEQVVASSGIQSSKNDDHDILSVSSRFRMTKRPKLIINICYPMTTNIYILPVFL